jgi:cytochrome c-type biogenesis protein CcmH/NrfG
VLSEVVKTHPTNLRGKIYLADSLAEDGKGDEAKKLVQEVLDARPGDDPPEDKRLRDMAKRWIASH